MKTVKHGFSEHAYNELARTAKWQSFPKTLVPVNYDNYAFKEAKSTARGISL